MQDRLVDKRSRPIRLLLVTFDLTGTVPGDARYAAADAALSGHGELFRPVKQVRLLITRSTSRRVKASLDQRLGRRTTVFVAPITSVPAWRIHGMAKRQEWAAFVQAIQRHGLDIRYLDADFEGGA